MTYSTRFMLVALVLAMAAPAFAEDMKMQHDAMPAATGSSSPADQALMATMTKMQKGMNAPMVGDADRDFAQMMIPHHQGAIDMAEVELRYGKDPAMRKLAKSIVDAQKREIALMQHWLARSKR